MNKSLFNISITLALMVAFCLVEGTGFAEPPGPPPDIAVVLSLDRTADQPYYPDDPILISLRLENLEPDDIIIRKGWRDMEFWLLLQFFDEKGNIITSDKVRESSTLFPPPPRVFPDGSGVLVQGTLVELLPSGWAVVFESDDTRAFDARDYYPLANRSGSLRVRAVIPGITFLQYNETATGEKYAPRYPTDTVKWHGSLESNAVSLTLVGDHDGDGYYYPLAFGETSPDVDCNDTDASVNPGATEIPNNGKDDDCDGIAQVIEPGGGIVAVNFNQYVLADAKGKESKKDARGKKFTGKDSVTTQKSPCAGVRVAAFDIHSECVSQLGLSWENYEQIMTECEQAAECNTNASGECSLETPSGSYHIIGEFEYDGEKHYSGVSAGAVGANETILRYLSLLTADGETMAGEYHMLTGSQLMIMQPQYMEWPAKQEKRSCPFVFESIGYWKVDVELSPPKRYNVSPKSIDGVKVNSDLVAVQADINKTPKAESGPLKVKYIIKHAKEKQKKIIETTIDMKVSQVVELKERRKRKYK